MTLEIDNTSFRSPYFNQRVHFLIMHYTAQNFHDSLYSLTESGQASVQYLIPQSNDPTYSAHGFSELKVFSLVDDVDRAWHAGVSSWGSFNGLNDVSIGIENVNVATDDNGVFTFPDYDPKQVELLVKLTGELVQKYPDMNPTKILGHSDIAVGRKSDPGPKFPWKQLYDSGYGAWYDDHTKTKYQDQFELKLPTRSDIVAKLSSYGYTTANAETDDSYYTSLLKAVQMHFRQSKYDGKLDAETAAVVYALTEKYTK